MTPHPENDEGKIRITLDDLNRISVPADAAAAGVKTYGSVTETPLPAESGESRASILMKGWC